MTLSLVMYGITFVTIPFVVYTTYHLIKWSIDVSKWERRMKENNSQAMFEDDDSVPNQFVIENHKIIPIDHLNDRVDFYSVVTPEKLIIFLDKSCAFCGGNFEDFISMHVEKGFDLKNLVVFFEYSQRDTAVNFSKLYDSTFSIFLTEDAKLRQSFDAPFLPIYAQIDENHFLTLRTPSPIFALYNAI